MKRLPVHLLLTAVTLIFTLSGLNLTALFDWDELIFAESAREMVVSNNWLYNQIGFEPFWEKPPLFIWLQALSYSVFGQLQAWVFKIPNVLAAVIVVNFAYHFGDKMGKRMLGAFWSLSLLLTFIPFIYWRSGLIDPIFNLFIIMALYQWHNIMQAYLKEERTPLYYLLLGVFLGLAFLTKGPVGILITGLVILIVTIHNGKWHLIFTPQILLSFLGLSLILSIWVLPLLQSNGSEFFVKFFQYQVDLMQGQYFEWHNQPWYYHIVVLFFLAFPASVLGLPHLFKNRIMDRNVEDWHSIMRVLFWVVLIFFSIVSTKLIHYSSLCWWPLTYFGAYQVYVVHTNRWKFPYALNLGVFLSGLGISAVLWAIPLAVTYKPFISILNLKLDPFTSSILYDAPIWNWTVFIPASLFTVWWLNWMLLSLLKKSPSPAYLFVISGLTSLMTSITLLPVASESLQGNLNKMIKSEVSKGHFLETWYFKTHALYFYGRFTPDDFKRLNPEWPAQKNEWYPKQTNRRSHAQNPSKNGNNIRIITRCDWEADYFFAEKFTPEKQLSGYILWKPKTKH
ncbi:MAG: glycosyltransferase family 39 protein [Bacteroidia bacterium]|nr:glycosyltransferase family 39 protein [Bacteroidia bacterium]